MDQFTLDTFILFVHDINRIKPFYIDLLGFKIVESYGDNWLLLDAGNAKIGLHKIGAEGLDSAASKEVIHNTKMVFSILSELEVVRQKFVEAGIVMKEIQHWDGYDYRVCDGLDPEGNVFQLKQYIH